MRVYFKHLALRYSMVTAVLALFLSVTSTSWAVNKPITQFYIYGVTSPIYNNKPLPDPLTQTTAFQQMSWDTNSLFDSNKVSYRHHGGGWLAFLVASIGDPSFVPSANFAGSTASYYGRYEYVSGAYLVHMDEYFGGFNPPGLFSSTAISYQTGKIWTATWQVYN